MGARITRILYGGFYGKPLTVLFWNIFAGATIVYACLLAIWGYLFVRGVAQDRHSRVNAAVSVCLFGAAAIYGMLLITQAVANRAGVDLSRLQHIAVPIVVVCAIAGMSLTLATVYGRPLWLRLHEWIPARQYRLRKDITGGIVLLSDRITKLLDYADQEAVAEVARRCGRAHLSAYQRRVAVEAARWITTSRRQAGETTWIAVEPETAQVIDEALANEAAAQAEDESYFYGDVYRVARLALGPEERPDLAYRWEGPGWRRRAARLLREVLTTGTQRRGEQIAQTGGG